MPALDVELVRLLGRRGDVAERAHRKKEAEERRSGLRWVGGRVLVQKAGGGEDIVRLTVHARGALLALEVACVRGDHQRVFFGGIVDGFGVAQRRLRVEEVIGAGGERYPLLVKCEGRYVLAECAPCVLD